MAHLQGLYLPVWLLLRPGTLREPSGCFQSGFPSALAVGRHPARGSPSFSCTEATRPACPWHLLRQHEGDACDDEDYGQRATPFWASRPRGHPAAPTALRVL